MQEETLVLPVKPQAIAVALPLRGHFANSEGGTQCRFLGDRRGDGFSATETGVGFSVNGFGGEARKESK